MVYCEANLKWRPLRRLGWLLVNRWRWSTVSRWTRRCGRAGHRVPSGSLWSAWPGRVSTRRWPTGTPDARWTLFGLDEHICPLSCLSDNNSTPWRKQQKYYSHENNNNNSFTSKMCSHWLSNNNNILFITVVLGQNVIWEPNYLGVGPLGLHST